MEQQRDMMVWGWCAGTGCGDRACFGDGAGISARRWRRCGGRRGGFTILELLVVIIIIAILAGVSFSVLPRLTESFSESAGRTQVSQAIERARVRAIQERQPSGVLFYVWRNPGFEGTEGDAEPAALVAWTEYIEVIGDAAEPGTFRPVDAWTALPDGFSVVAPGRQLPQLDYLLRTQITYPNLYRNLQPTGDAAVLGAGLAVLFDEFGRIDLAAMRRDLRMVEMILAAVPGEGLGDYLGPDGYADRMFVLDGPEGDRIGAGLQSVIDDPGALIGNTRMRVDGFSMLTVQAARGEVTVDPREPVLVEIEDGPNPFTARVRPQGYHFVDRDGRPIVSTDADSIGANLENIDVEFAFENADDFKFGSGDPRPFVAARAFGLTNVLAVVEVEELTQQYAAARRAVGGGFNYQQERDFGGGLTVLGAGRDPSPVDYWGEYRRDAQFEEWQFSGLDESTNRYARAIAAWDWIALHPYTGRPMPILQGEIEP